MARQSHLLKRNGRYYVNRKVPDDLVAVLGKKLIRYALGTGEHKEAVERVRLESAKIDARFGAARRGPIFRRVDHPIKHLTETEVEQMALLWFSDRERAIRDAEVNVAPQVSRDEALQDATEAVAVLADPKDRDTFAAMHKEAERLMENNGFDLRRDSRAYRLLVDLIRRGLLETTRRGADRLNGEYSGKRHDQFFGRSPGASPERDGESVSEVRDRWFAENEARWAKAVPFTAVAREVKKIVESLDGSVTVGLDSTGPGEGLTQELRRQDVRCIAFKMGGAGHRVIRRLDRWSVPSHTIYEGVYQLLVQRRLRINPQHPLTSALVQELDSCEVGYTTTGLIKYEVPRSGGSHGDMLVALGIAATLHETPFASQVNARARGRGPDKVHERRPGAARHGDAAREVIAERLERSRWEAEREIWRELWRE